MARFLFCSFALVLLYPSGIDMYLVGLPHIARDLGASEAQLHIAFSAYLAGMASSMVFSGKSRIKQAVSPSPLRVQLSLRWHQYCLQWLRKAQCSCQAVLSRALARAAVT